MMNQLPFSVFLILDFADFILAVSSVIVFSTDVSCKLGASLKYHIQILFLFWFQQDSYKVLYISHQEAHKQLVFAVTKWEEVCDFLST